MNKCYTCKHISCNGQWKNGRLIGLKYSCDLKKTEPEIAPKMIQVDNCSVYEKHPNQRILGEYLLNLRPHKY